MSEGVLAGAMTSATTSGRVAPTTPTSALRVVHYVNQFFAGVGAEAESGTAPGRKEGAVGPAIALQRELGDRGQVVSTVYCGDNYAVEMPEAIDRIVELIRQEKPDLVVAGPAFGAGRYGLACGQICAAVQERLGITAVAGMHAENAGADIYRTKVYIASTGNTAAGMNEAIRAMVRLALKLQARQKLGSPHEEGYLSMGRRVHFFDERNASDRALEMLLHRVRSEPFTTEWEVPHFSRVIPATPIKDLSKARIALVSTGGVVPQGNPDRLEPRSSTKWLKYPLKGLDRLTPEGWQAIHAGYNTTAVNEDPNRMVPLDVLRALETEGEIGSLLESLYTTTGNGSLIPTARRFAQEIVRDLKAADVDGIILTSA